MKLSNLNLKGSPRFRLESIESRRVAGEAGFTHVVLLFIAAIGFLVFVLVTSVFPFKDELYNRLFPKPPSHASEQFNRFAISGCSGGPNADIYCYTWDNFSDSVVPSQSEPAPNHKFPWMVGKLDGRHDNLGCGFSGGQSKPPCTTADIDQIFAAEEPKIRSLLAQQINKNGVWIIGNEANLGGPKIPADLYAYQFKKYWDLIKSLDPTARIAHSGLLYRPDFDQLGSPQDPAVYLGNFIHELNELGGVKGIKPDIYNIHFYPGSNLGDDQIQQSFEKNKAAAIAFSNYVNLLDPSKPIWVTEFGIHPSWATTGSPPAALVNRYMDFMVNYFISNPKYQRWFWFISHASEDFWKPTSLLTPDGQALTEVGQHYRELAIAKGDLPGPSSSPVPTVSPTQSPIPTVQPTPTPTPAPVLSTISGRVYKDDNKNNIIENREVVTGAGVAIDTRRVNTSNGGYYIFRNLPNGNYTVSLASPIPAGYTFNDINVTISGASAINKDLRLVPVFIPTPTTQPTAAPTVTPTSRPTPLPQTNLLINGDFVSSTLANWGCGGGASGGCQLDSSTKYSGNYSAKVTNTGGSWGWQLAQQPITAVANEKFCLSAWVKKQNIRDYVTIAIQETNAPWWSVDLRASRLTTDWQQVRNTVTRPSWWGTSTIQVYLRVWSNSSANFDDVSLTRGACR